jgi:hypothetical protein
MVLPALDTALNQLLKNLQQRHRRRRRADLAVGFGRVDHIDQFRVFIGLAVFQVGHVHVPARERAEFCRLVVEQARILVARVFFDFLEQLGQRRRGTFQHLQEPAAVVEQAAGDIDGAVIVLGGLMDRGEVCGGHFAGGLADIDELIEGHD